MAGKDYKDSPLNRAMDVGGGCVFVGLLHALEALGQLLLPLLALAASPVILLFMLFRSRQPGDSSLRPSRSARVRLKSCATVVKRLSNRKYPYAWHQAFWATMRDHLYPLYPELDENATCWRESVHEVRGVLVHRAMDLAYDMRRSGRTITTLDPLRIAARELTGR